MKREGLKRMKWQVSIIALIIFCVNLIPLPQKNVQAAESLKPIVNEDGTVTFQVKYSGDTLYLVGDMNNWANDNNKPYKMVKGEDGIFRYTTEAPLKAGNYGYKYKPNVNDWTGAFNQEGVDANSILIIKPLGTIQNEDGTVTFRVKYSGDKLYLIGDMNSWNGNIEMTKGTDGVFEVTIPLAPGTYGYKYKPNVNDWVGAFNQEGNNADGCPNSSVTVTGKVNVVSPVDNGDGTVTFATQYSGDTLYLIGDLTNNWDVKSQIAMTKDENGVFSVTIPLEEGTYNYKFKPNAEDWTGAFTDPNNTEVVGGNSVVYVGAVQKVQKKTVVFKYFREDQDYADWNIWTWSTGLADGQVDFTEVKDGYAIAKFEVAASTTSVGFKIRKGTGWDNIDYNSDRYVPIDPDMDVTKVTVVSGKGDVISIPSIQAAVINNGKIDFKYRNKELFASNEQIEKISKVQVEVTTPNAKARNANVYDMEYDAENEYYAYSLKNIEEGTYTYKFIITYKDGTLETEEPASLVYEKKDIKASAQISPESINSGENAVLTLKLSGNNAKVEDIREVYVDLSSIGGPSKMPMSKTLLSDGKIRQAIGVTDSTTAGKKTIPVTIIDVNGEITETSANVTVEAKSSVGGALDFSFDEAVIYQVVTDRYLNGDKSNDDPNNNGYDKVNDAFTYHGGDFKGLTSKIDYLKDLGINTIWISPIVKNTDINQNSTLPGGQWSYHGYWADDFTLLDPHFGTEEDLKELIDTAHENGIKIMVDVVLNHAGYGTKALSQFDGMIRDKDGGDIFTNASSGLPDFKTEDPVVRAKLIKWQTDWIKKLTTESGNTIDYFRIDTVKHVEDDTWKEFKTALTEIDPEFKVIGEWYGADVNTDAGQLQSGQMDALLDFGYKSIASNFVNGKISEMSTSLDDRADKINNTYLLGQFLSSHDEHGFIANVDGDVDDEITDEDRIKGLVAASLQITDKGIPVIYYGEEFGVSAKNSFDDGDLNRYDMDFDLVNTTEGSRAYNHYKNLLAIRNEYSEIFAKGKRITLAADDEKGYTVFARTYNNKAVVTMLNIKDEDIKVEVDLSKLADLEGINLQDIYNDSKYDVSKDGKVVVTIPAASKGGTVVFDAINLDSDTPNDDHDDGDDIKNPQNSGNNGNNTTSNKTKTGDYTMNTIIMISMLFVAAGSLAVISKKMEKEENN